MIPNRAEQIRVDAIFSIIMLLLLICLFVLCFAPYRSLFVFLLPILIFFFYAVTSLSCFDYIQVGTRTPHSQVNHPTKTSRLLHHCNNCKE